MAADLLGSFEPGMLVLADRNFYSYTAWQQACQTGTELLWRVQSTLKLPVVTPLPDGSWLSIVFPAGLRDYHRRELTAAVAAGRDVPAAQAIVVRVIEYQVPDREGNGKGEIIRLTRPCSMRSRPINADPAACSARNRRTW